MNPGGIRTNLVENVDGNVTYGAAFAVQPFNNYVTSFDLTGAQILAVLNQQWNGLNEGPSANKILQISGLQYTWDRSDAATGRRQRGDRRRPGRRERRRRRHRGARPDQDLPGRRQLVPRRRRRRLRHVRASANKYIGGLDIDALALELTSGTGAYVPPPTGRIVAQD